MEKSSFKYWFAHWCAFQMTALNLDCWKFRFLFHDIEKPWLKLFMPYEKVRKIHRKFSRHHPNSVRSSTDYLQLVIDWECSRLTKGKDEPSGREYFENCKKLDKLCRYDEIQIEKTFKLLGL